MLVGTSARRVAIIGGVRIPFARGNGAYARVGNQEMLTDGTARRGRALRPAGPAPRRRGGGRRDEALEPMEPDARVGAGLGSRRGNARARPAARLRHQPRGGHRAGQQNRAGPDRQRHRRAAWIRSATRRSSFRGLSAAPAQRAIAARARAHASARGSACDSGTFGPVCRVSPSRAPGLSMGESTELMVKTWEHRPRRAGSARAGKPSEGRRGLCRRVLQGSGASSIWASRRTTTSAADTSLEKLAKLKPGVRPVGRRHAHRGQLDAR